MIWEECKSKGREEQIMRRIWLESKFYNQEIAHLFTLDETSGYFWLLDEWKNRFSRVYEILNGTPHKSINFQNQWSIKSSSSNVKNSQKNTKLSESLMNVKFIISTKRPQFITN